jgi:hypothetical protein
MSGGASKCVIVNSQTVAWHYLVDFDTTFSAAKSRQERWSETTDKKKSLVKLLIYDVRADVLSGEKRFSLEFKSCRWR